MNVKFQVLGYKDFNRKSDNKAMTILTVVSVCTPDDIAHGLHGMKATDFFLPDNMVGTLTDKCLGQEFIPEYEINGFGRPALSGCRFEAWKDN